ncbi:MAG TPA: hypothetical protein VFN55_07675 [Solirubrobacteraceae bacterium]|nr:hypothetical protein [Solirubrobacteraceae bacterium]
MAGLAIQGDELVVTLSAFERLVALHGDVRVPLAAVSEVRLESDPWCALRGVRAPGTGFPGVIAYGVRRGTGGRPDFAAVLGRGAAVRVELTAAAPYARLLVTVTDPGATVAAVARGVGG